MAYTFLLEWVFSSTVFNIVLTLYLPSFFKFKISCNLNNYCSVFFLSFNVFLIHCKFVHVICWVFVEKIYFLKSQKRNEWNVSKRKNINIFVGHQNNSLFERRVNLLLGNLLDGDNTTLTWQEIHSSWSINSHCLVLSI